VHAGAHKSAAKSTHHKAKTAPDTAKPEAAAGAAATTGGAAKAAAPDNTKKQ
jgi:hypothetical protein